MRKTSAVCQSAEENGQRRGQASAWLTTVERSASNCVPARDTRTHKDQRSTKEKKKGKKEGGEVVLSEKRKRKKENTVTMEKDMCSPRRKERTGVSLSYRVKPLTCKTCNTTRRSVQALQSWKRTNEGAV